MRMAKRYKKLPSEILRIKYDYLAYMIDDVCIFMEDKATDKKGNIDWNKLLNSNSGNMAMMEHAKKVNKRN